MIILSKPVNGKPKEQVETLIKYLPVGKRCKLSFSKHVDEAVLVSVELATLEMIKDRRGNIPEKRHGKTPPAVMLGWYNGQKVFKISGKDYSYFSTIVMEDMNVDTKIGKTIIYLPSCEITMEVVQ